MKTLIRLEELAMLAFSIFLFYLSPFAWWWYPALILFGHSSLDRMLGYGLKHNDSFQNTHLGKIGK